MKKVLALSISLIFMVIMLVGCGGSGKAALVGNWLLEEGQSFDGVTEDYTLLSDGTGIADIQGEISWKVENGRFVTVSAATSKASERDYKLSGKSLMITYDDGKIYTYKKVKNTNDFRKWRSCMAIDPINDENRIFFRVISRENNNRLYIRQYGKNSPEIYIHWGGGEIDGNNLDVIFRIGDGEAESSRWSLSNTKESTFYRENALEIIEKLLDAEQVVARCNLGTKGIITAIFDFTGFKDLVEKYNDYLSWF